MSKLNASVESQVRQWTDDFKAKEIDIASINVDESQNNNNRGAGKLDEDNCKNMSLAIDRGVVLPPIVVNKTQSGRHVVIDGNHRVHAKTLADKQTIEAFIVEVNPDIFLQMCLWFNTTNGQPLTHSQRVDHALTAVRNGMELTQAERMYGIKADHLGKKRKAQEGRRKAASAGLNAAAKITSEGLLAQMSRLEVEHIRSIGAVIADVNINELAAAVNAINNAPAAERGDEAIRQSGRLEQQVKSKHTPKTRIGKTMTMEQVRTSLRRSLTALGANSVLLNDPTISSLIDELAKLGGDRHAEENKVA
jgi:uncharacterized ParB-like nuclease family protein